MTTDGEGTTPKKVFDRLFGNYRLDSLSEIGKFVERKHNEKKYTLHWPSGEITEDRKER